MPKKIAKAVGVESAPAVEKAVMSITEFCAAHGFSKATYFNLKKAGQGPREIHIGRRVVISHEAAAMWRREREAA